MRRSVRSGTLTRCALLGVLLVAGEARAGGWTQAEGAWYVKAWGRLLSGGRGFVGDGANEALGRDFTDQAFNLYGEYGLLPDTTLVVQATPFGRAAVGDASTLYIGPLGLGARQRLYAGAVQLAVEGRYFYQPDVGEEVLARGVAGGDAWVYVPTVETHRFDAEVQLGAGLPAGLWLSAAAGLRAHTRDALDPAVIGLAQLGWSSSFGLVAELHGTLYEPLGDVEPPFNVAGTGQTRYVGLGLGLSYWFHPSWAVSLGADSAPFAVANAAAAPLTLGIEHRGGP